MYGFADKAIAEEKANDLQKRNPTERYEVGMHKHLETNIWGRGDKTVTWGVKRYVPYCEAMPWRFDGFVWF